MKKIFYSVIIKAAFLSFPAIALSQGTVTDFDGNVYATVKIGNQEWMAENLRATHYADGTALADGKGVEAIWNDFTSKYWFVYNDTTPKETFGCLYTWAAAMNGVVPVTESPVQGVCPNGWQLPSKTDWETLVTYLGGPSEAGGKMKSLTGWGDNNISATNESGFSALPAGMRNPGGLFQFGAGDSNPFAYFWSSSESNTEGDALAIGVYWFAAIADTNMVMHKEQGHSVRCVKAADNSDTTQHTAIKIINKSFRFFSASGSNYIKIEGPDENLRVNIYSMNGAKVMTVATNCKSTEVNTSNLKAGVYIATIISGTRTESHKFIKH